MKTKYQHLSSGALGLPVTRRRAVQLLGAATVALLGGAAAPASKPGLYAVIARDFTAYFPDTYGKDYEAGRGVPRALVFWRDTRSDIERWCSSEPERPPFNICRFVGMKPEILPT